MKSVIYLVVYLIILVPQDVVSIKIDPGDNFGYRIGDIVTTRVSIKFSGEYSLNNQALKTPGTEVARDIEFKGVTIEKNGNEYDLKINYQVFIAPEGVYEFKLPQEKLKFKNRDSGHEIEVVIPTRTARISPLLDYPANITKTSTTPIKYNSIKDFVRKMGFQDDAWPILAIDNRPLKFTFKVLASLSSLLSLAVIILWIRSRIVFYTSPLAVAYREVKLLKRVPVSEDRVKQELKIFHRAINERSSKTIFLHNLNNFFSILDNKKMEEEVREIFEASEELIYKEVPSKNPAELSDKIRRTLKALRGIDRT